MNDPNKNNYTLIYTNNKKYKNITTNNLNKTINKNINYITQKLNLTHIKKYLQYLYIHTNINHKSVNNLKITITTPKTKKNNQHQFIVLNNQNPLKTHTYNTFNLNYPTNFYKTFGDPPTKQYEIEIYNTITNNNKKFQHFTITIIKNNNNIKTNNKYQNTQNIKTNNNITTNSIYNTTLKNKTLKLTYPIKTIIKNIDFTNYNNPTKNYTNNNLNKNTYDTNNSLTTIEKLYKNKPNYSINPNTIFTNTINSYLTNNLLTYTNTKLIHTINNKYINDFNNNNTNNNLQIFYYNKITHFYLNNESYP